MSPRAIKREDCGRKMSLLSAQKPCKRLRASLHLSDSGSLHAVSRARPREILKWHLAYAEPLPFEVRVIRTDSKKRPARPSAAANCVAGPALGAIRLRAPLFLKMLKLANGPSQSYTCRHLNHPADTHWAPPRRVDLRGRANT